MGNHEIQKNQGYLFSRNFCNRDQMVDGIVKHVEIEDRRCYKMYVTCEGRYRKLFSRGGSPQFEWKHMSVMYCVMVHVF